MMAAYHSNDLSAGMQENGVSVLIHHITSGADKDIILTVRALVV